MNYLEQPVSAKSLEEYLLDCYPYRRVAPNNDVLVEIAAACLHCNYTTLFMVNELLLQTEDARKKLEKPNQQYSISEVAYALALLHDEYLRNDYFQTATIVQLERARQFLSPTP